MCVIEWLCVRVCVHERVRMCMGACVCVSVCACVLLSVCACVRAWTRAYVHGRVRVCECVLLFVSPACSGHLLPIRWHF